MSNFTSKLQEMSMEMRLLLALVLMGVVLILTPYFIKTPEAEIAKKADAPNGQKKNEPKPAQPAEPAPPPAPPADGQIASASQDDAVSIETDLYSIRLSNRGAVVRSWVLKKYKDQNGKPVDLVNKVGGEKLGYPFHIVAKSPAPPTDPNAVLYRVKKTDDGLGVDFEFHDGKIHARKSFRFEKNRYVVQFTSDLREAGRPTPHLVAWRGGFGDFLPTNALSTQHSLYFDTTANALEVKSADDAGKGVLTAVGRMQFAGIEDTYFTAVAIPPPGATWEVQTWSDKLPLAPQNKEELHVGVAMGGEGVNKAAVFVGPKDIDTLKQVDPRLEQVVDFGWWWFIAKPLFQGLHWINDGYLRNWGWSIVVVTILINILMLPVKFSSLKSMKRMAEIQPQIKAIQEKYSHMKVSDPRRQEQQSETMALYKKHGVNPLGGCLPMALPIPFFFAFYKVLSVAIELRGASWLWVSDLSQPETIALRILPLATIATQFVLQKMTPNTSMDPQQQRIMMMMPLMFIFIFWNVASGLVLYWFTGNLVGIAQQWFFNRTAAASAKASPVAAAAPAVTPKKKR